MRTVHELADQHRFHRNRTSAVRGRRGGLDTADLFQERPADPDRRRTGTAGRRCRGTGRPRGALPATSVPSTVVHSPTRSRRRSLDGTVDGRTRRAGRAQLPPRSNLPHTVDTVRRDLTALRRRAARRGARLVGIGVDPDPASPRRITDEPRYVAMERYLDAWGPAGRTMMCSTASVQVNVEAGVAPPPTPTPRRQPLRSGDRIRSTVGSAARDRPDAGRRLRQLAAPRGPADRLEEHPAGGLAAAGPGPHRRPAAAGPARTWRPPGPAGRSMPR